VIYEYCGEEPVVVTVCYPFAARYFKGGEPMKIKYSRDADAPVIQLGDGKPADSRDIKE
jgi:hypothetical protein